MARTDYYTGCRHYGLLSRELTKEGKEKDWQYFDENRLVIAGKPININKKDDYESGVFPTPPQA
jgi:hypothetical protein